MTTTLFTDVHVYDAGSPTAMTGPMNVVVDGQRIAAVGDDVCASRSWDTTIVEGHGHHLLAPGLINAHFHSPANHLKGSLPSLPLETVHAPRVPRPTTQLRPSPP